MVVLYTHDGWVLQKQHALSSIGKTIIMYNDEDTTKV